MDVRHYKLSVVGSFTYIIIAIFFLLFKDKDHALMFFCGSFLWGISSLVWRDNAKDSGEM